MFALVVEGFDIKIHDCGTRDGGGGLRPGLGFLGEEATENCHGWEWRVRERGGRRGRREQPAGSGRGVGGVEQKEGRGTVAGDDGAGTVGSRWMWSKTDEGRVPVRDSIKRSPPVALSGLCLRLTTGVCTTICWPLAGGAGGCQNAGRTTPSTRASQAIYPHRLFHGGSRSASQSRPLRVPALTSTRHVQTGMAGSARKTSKTSCVHRAGSGSET